MMVWAVLGCSSSVSRSKQVVHTCTSFPYTLFHKWTTQLHMTQLLRNTGPHQPRQMCRVASSVPMLQ